MSKKIIAIVPAAGVGERARMHTAPVAGAEGVVAAARTGAQEALPKQYRLLKGEPMLRWAVKALLADTRIDQVRVAVAVHDGWVAQALAGLPRTIWRFCGGPSRAATVAASLLDAQLQADDWVLVHDAARPGLPPEALGRLIDTCLRHGTGGLLALPVSDTVKQSVSRCGSDEVSVTVPRDALWLAQTPQMFPAERLVEALQMVQVGGITITDEAQALEHIGYHPWLVPGSVRNFKVTWPEDFELMEKWL
ncbi:MAG: 2-C-methyl-D-erythritol 4-phosphate cytidylyltransferase [Paralcaligenes sp.]